MDQSPPPSTPPFSPIVPRGTKCTRHADRPASYRCIDCGAFTCSICDFAIGLGGHACPACMRKRNTAASAGAAPAPTPGEAPSTAEVSAAASPPLKPTFLPGDLRCVQHPSVPAIGYCDTCGAGTCATCMFDVPGGMHLCPVCAMAPKVVLSAKRKRAMVIAYVLAGVSTVGMILLLMDVLSPLYLRFPMLLAEILIRLMTFFPSVAGVATAVGAMDKKLGNPPALWAAAIWNVILLVAFLAVLLIGVLMY